MRRVIFGGGSAADNLNFTLGCEGSTTAALASCMRRLKYALIELAPMLLVSYTNAHLYFASKFEYLTSIFIVMTGIIPYAAHLVFE